MQDLFHTVLLLSLLGSGPTLVLLCLKPILSRMVPPRWQTWLWVAVLLAMVLPIYKLVPTPPPDLTLPTIQPQAEADSPAVSPQMDQEETNQLPSPTPQPQETSPVSHRLTLNSLCYLWLAGTGAFLAFLLGSYGRFYSKLLKNSICISEHPLLDEVRQVLDIRRAIPLRVAPGLSSPILVGIFFPVVCLPEQGLPEAQLRMVLLHELTHYKRKDLLLKWLALLVNAVHWFNPLAWLLTRSLGQTCEDACDRDVTRNMTPQERKLYMSTILTLAQA